MSIPTSGVRRIGLGADGWVIALWLGICLLAGELITTGTCMPSPTHCAPGK